jgi:nitrogen regulatory protein P-II 1
MPDAPLAARRASARLTSLSARIFRRSHTRFFITDSANRNYFRRELMTKLEAIIRPNKFEQVKDAVAALGVQGMTVSEVRGHGRQKGQTENYRGREYDISLLPKLKVEIVLEDKLVDAVIEAIIKNAVTGEIGDGKIFLYKAEDAIRIRNRERGEVAL